MIDSLESDLGHLGYSADEFMDRYRHAILLGSLVSLIYMVFVIGGKVIATIYGLDGGDASGQVSSSAATQVGGAARQRPARHPRLDMRNWLECLATHRVLQSLRGLKGAYLQ